MTAVALKPPPAALALLALAAVYYMTRRNASATGTGTSGLPSSGLASLFGGGRAGTPASNPAVRSYLVPSNNALRLPQASATQRAETSTNVVNQGLSLVQAVMGLVGRSGASANPSNNAPQYYGGEIFRPADFVPNYTPDTAGEAAAQQYFYSNPDEFITNPPATFVYNDGIVGGTGGYLDSQ